MSSSILYYSLGLHHQEALICVILAFGLFLHLYLGISANWQGLLHCHDHHFIHAHNPSDDQPHRWWHPTLTNLQPWISLQLSFPCLLTNARRSTTPRSFRWFDFMHLRQLRQRLWRIKRQRRLLIINEGGRRRGPGFAPLFSPSDGELRSTLSDASVFISRLFFFLISRRKKRGK